MQLSKVLIEAIDRICEDSIRHPCIPDNGIFVTDEARTSEDDHIADIAAFIAYMCVENSDIQNDLEVIVKELLREIWRVNKLCRLLREELAQIQGHLLNLDKRMFTLEQKRGKIKSSYD